MRVVGWSPNNTIFVSVAHFRSNVLTRCVFDMFEMCFFYSDIRSDFVSQLCRSCDSPTSVRRNFNILLCLTLFRNWVSFKMSFFGGWVCFKSCKSFRSYPDFATDLNWKFHILRKLSTLIYSVNFCSWVVFEENLLAVCKNGPVLQKCSLKILQN